jgi:fatty-acyl-CoA synthase
MLPIFSAPLRDEGNASEQSRPWIDGLTIGQVLAETARRFAHREAIVFPQAGVRMRYAEFATAVADAAKGLIALGVRPGEHVGIWATNIPEWVLLQYAAASIGVVLVTINPAYRALELSYTIGQSDIVALFLTDRFKTSEYYSIFAEICPEIAAASGGRVNSTAFSRLRRAVAMKGHPPSGFLHWKDMIAAGRAIPDHELDPIAGTLKASDAINIQYTSGTTGFPKAAMLTHRNILMNAWYITEMQAITENDRMCVQVPFYHCFGCVMGSLGAIVRGAAIVVPAEYFDARASLETVETERCTIIYGVPTMFVAMLEEESLHRRNLKSLRSGIMAGSSCPIEVMRKVIDVMGCRGITIAYGQTETSPVLTQSSLTDPIEVRVQNSRPGFARRGDPDRRSRTGKDLPDGERGELWARGHGTMLGYCKNPEATAATIDHDGWVHTGDLAIRRADGCYKIAGRLKDMIIRGGENIYPREIEEFLFTHSAVAQVAAFGVPDPKYGEELCVWVQLRPGHTATADDIRAFCKENVAHYKVPRYVKFVTEFPTTVSGKIQKFKMREIMCAELNLKDQATA